MAETRSISTLHDHDEYSVVELLRTLWSHRALIAVTTVVGAAVSIGVAMILPRYYLASTLLLPPQQGQSAAMGALAQLGSLAGLSGVSSPVKSPDEIYVAFLKTRRVQDALIQQFKLVERYKVNSIESARDVLNMLVGVGADKKSGLITLTVEDQDPSVAASIANAHVGELRKMLGEFAITEAQQRRLFLEQQVKKTSDLLNESEAKFKAAQQEGGMVVTQALAEYSVRGSLELRRKIAAQEVAEQTLSAYVTSHHPDLQKIRVNLAALRSQLERLEQGTGEAAVKFGSEGSEKNVGATAVNAYRDMKVHEAALEALVRQYEMAKLDESREGPVLQQVDVAVPPETPSRPRRKMVVLGGATLSLLLGMLLATVVAMRSKRATNVQ